MTTPNQPDQPLPGLDEPAAAAGQLERSVRRTLAELQKRGHLSEATAAHQALALELAQVIAMKRQTGRASTIGNDARVLLELLTGLVPEAAEGAGVDEELRRAMAEWAAAQAAVEQARHRQAVGE